MATLIDALELMQAGDWNSAHLIAQADESAIGSWAHGIVHLMEGDLSNAGHWYRKAGRPLPSAGSAAGVIEAEIADLAEALKLP